MAVLSRWRSIEVADISRWWFYRGGGYIEVAEYRGGGYIDVAVLSRWRIYRGGGLSMLRMRSYYNALLVPTLAVVSGDAHDMP